MNIKINTVHFDADKNLLEFVEGRLEKLEKYDNKIVLAEVFLKFDKGQSKKDNKIVKIKLDIPGTELFAEKESKSFEESTDLVVDALIKQIKKYREKLRS